jgi:hypothetical protein
MKNTKKIKVAVQKTVVVSKPSKSYTFFRTREEAIQWLFESVDRRLRENPELARPMPVPENERYCRVIDEPKWWTRCAS